MELIKLSANKQSFRTVEFKNGFNLIVGKMSNPDEINTKMTYNGVGKSLIIRLIHFCLGSNAMSEFAEKLGDWIFTLEFKVGASNYSASRYTCKQNKIILNGSEISIKDFREKMSNELFKIDPDTSNLTFRSLLSRFIRPKSDSYTKYDKFESKEQPFAQLINNAFLLGLDVLLIQKKCLIKEDLKEIELVERGVKQDGITKEILLGGTDTKIELVDLREKISALQKNLKDFKIAKDYNDIEKEANVLSFKAKEINNEIVVLLEATKNINNTLSIRPDIKRQTILDLYTEAKVIFDKSVIKSVTDIEDFHSKLLENRKKRLDSEKRRLERKLAELDEAMDAIDKEKNKKMKYLDTHGALEEFVSLTNNLNDLKFKYEKIENSEKIISNCKQKTLKLKKLLIEENIKTAEYLESKQELIERNISIFRDFSKEFYEGKAAGIEITNNEGNNATRFNIRAKIDDDASDGINSVKIFCFDMTLLTAKHNHIINFIFHDSRLFSDMDPRQRSVLFKIVNRMVSEKNIQYIASVNQDTLDSISTICDKDYFKNEILNNIILELTDESEKSKLLGIELNLESE